MRFAIPLALLLLAASGCSDPAPTPTPAPLATAGSGLDALSEAGHLAHQVLNDSETFADGSEGKGGPCVEGMAFRLLLREEPAAAKAAFADLRVPGGGARRLYGLCGAWYTDRAAFEEGCRELAKWPDSETVRFRSGCEYFEKVPVATLVRSRGAGPSYASDIESGALPRSLGGRKGK